VGKGNLVVQGEFQDEPLIRKNKEKRNHLLNLGNKRRDLIKRIGHSFLLNRSKKKLHFEDGL